MTKTNIDLAIHAQKFLEMKVGYVWGTFGQVLTEKLLQQKLKQYPSGVGNYIDFIRKTWLNKRTCDCIGLIKSCLWFDGKDYKYNAAQDISADMSFNRAKEKGTMETMPEIPGICVWKKGHIGVYIGNGWVIEAAGTKRGVVKTPLEGRGSTAWTHWLKHPFIQYVEVKPTPTFLTLSLNGVDYQIDNFKNIEGSLFVGLREILTDLGYKNISYEGENSRISATK